MSIPTSGAEAGTVPAPAPLFNPLSPEFIADPYPFYDRLRTEDPVHFSPLGAWVLTRYADVMLVLRDPRFGREGFAAFMLAQFGAGPLQESFSKWLLFMDPPSHSRLRGLVSKAFTPKVVEGMRPHIQELVDGLLAPFEDAAGMDLVADLAHPLPVAVICELLDVPVEDRRRFDHWSHDLARAMDAVAVPTPETLERGNEAAQGLTEYFRGLIAARRARPGQDLLSGLIAAEEQGSKLDEEELLATCVLLFFAGHETTVNLISNGMLALLRHPDQLALLRDQPGLLPGAVEELLRYDGPVQRVTRIAKQDVEIGGKTIRQGQRVTAVLGAAQRDPAQFPQPERLDITRGDHRHLAFAAGIHYCLGAPLARAEAQIAIGTLLARRPGLKLGSEAPEWRPTSALRGLKTLPVSW